MLYNIETHTWPPVLFSEKNQPALKHTGKLTSAAHKMALFIMHGTILGQLVVLSCEMTSDTFSGILLGSLTGERSS